MNKTLLASIQEKISDISPDRVFLLTDSNVAEIERTLISELMPREIIVVPAGEESKSLEEVSRIASRLSAGGATRNSLLVCAGGGMVTDLGGFVAAIFKRGIKHINVSTTLLGAVDASVGGKTGIDFSGLKNELGAFHMPVEVFADVDSFKTLPTEEVLSGFGEVIKTAYLDDAEMAHRLIATDPFALSGAQMEEVCHYCRNVKLRIVEEDPTEKGLRKVLNLGHTAGHAFESLMREKGKPVPHGVAVAHGLLVTLLLSMECCGLRQEEVSRYAGWLRRYYPILSFTCADYDRFWQLARHDKKNSGVSENLNFVLLASVGDPIIDQPIDKRNLENALDLYQELQGR